MFCYQCGKKLHENARFCSNCGAPVRETSGQTDSARQAESDIAAAKEADSQAEISAVETEQANDSADCSKKTDPQTAVLSVETKVPAPQATAVSADTTESNPHTADTSANTADPASQEASDIGTSADLILKKGKVTVTGTELHLNKKHYVRKSGKKKFKKEKNPSVIHLESILSTSTEHHKYGGRIFLSFLLLLCFAAGALFSAHHSIDTYNELNAPYRDKELAELENIMAVIDNDGAGQLLRYQNDQRENRAEAEVLSADLAELNAQQTQEILTAIYSSDKFDLDDFFNRELFSHAYQDYLQDLLNAFKADESLHSWLYSYYETTKEYGGNYFLNTDMWIYNGSEENNFSAGLDSAVNLMNEQYDLDLYEHILYTGRIYITGADFMREILSLPRYTVEGAVFVKAYGGAPDASKLSVPGWSRSHYEEFWLYSADYYDVKTPMWLDYGLQSENFDLDWNALVNEPAYYDAYQNFMDIIAPNLPRHEMVSYHADDTAYGGMGFNLKGTEPSFSDIVASYAESHPEFIDELKESGIYNKALTTSVDEEIAAAEALLEKLEGEFLNLQEQEKELAQILADADIYRSNHTLLLADMEQHTQELSYRLLFFGSIALLCALSALICLYKFFSFFKRPRHLFIISRQDMDFAFNTRHYPKEQISALQNRLPLQEKN